MFNNKKKEKSERERDFLTFINIIEMRLYVRGR